MLVIDCDSRESALDSVSALYRITTATVEEFLRSFDIEAHYAKYEPSRYPDQVLRYVFESTLGRKPVQIDRVFWFHLTRARHASDFANGLYPLTASLDRVWRTILDVFRGTTHEVRLLEMRQSGVPNFQYELKVGNPLHGGPYAMLVREVATYPSELGNHDYLWLPEIMEDICNGYQKAHGESIHDTLNRALVPIIVKFWSARQCGLGCIESTIYYLYLTAHNRGLNMNANTCFDGKNETIPQEQIVRAEVVDT